MGRELRVPLKHESTGLPWTAHHEPVPQRAPGGSKDDLIYFVSCYIWSGKKQSREGFCSLQTVYQREGNCCPRFERRMYSVCVYPVPSASPSRAEQAARPKRVSVPAPPRTSPPRAPHPWAFPAKLHLVRNLEPITFINPSEISSVQLMSKSED